MKKTIFIFIYFLCTLSILYSQQMDIIWQQCLGTDENDYPGCIAATNNGILSSTTIGKSAPGISYFHGGGDSWVVNIDTLGNIVWEKCFGGSNADNFNKIIELPNNKYFLLGGTNSNDGDIKSYNHDSYDIWVVKIDSSGNIIWEKCYGSFWHEGLDAAVTTIDGGLILGSMILGQGGDISNFYGQRDVWLCRIDSVGNILWEKTFGNQGMNRINSLFKTSKGSYMFIGGFHEAGGMITCQKDSSSMETDVWLVEFDIDGQIIDQYCYDGSRYEDGNIIIEVDGGYVFLSATNSNDMDVSGLHDGSYPGGVPYPDIWIVKIDTIGNIIWQSCLGGTNIESASTLFKTEDNGYMIFGSTWSIDDDVTGNHKLYGDRPDIWVVKINDIGELQWQQCIGSSGREFIMPNCISKIDEYNYAISYGASILSGDVECLINPTGEYRRDAWVFQIKDCSQYQPTQPQQPTGQDTLCVNTDSITTYTTQFTNGAWAYEWQLAPEDAGTIQPDSLTAQIHWNPTYEGSAIIKVRSTNDCGTSAWSDSIVVNTYICLGTEEYEDDLPVIMVYPNPVRDVLLVEYNWLNKAHSTSGTLALCLTIIEIVDIYGGVVAKQYLPTGNQKIGFDVKNIAPGLYFVRVVENGEVVGVRKVVVE